jgi:AraC-like DNA-binding protein
VALRLERGDAVSLAWLAAELGYTDQAHLARDFKGAVGKSPSEFAVTVHR